MENAKEQAARLDFHPAESLAKLHDTGNYYNVFENVFEKDHDNVSS
jgi:hypothetical protein